MSHIHSTPEYLNKLSELRNMIMLPPISLPASNKLVSNLKQDVNNIQHHSTPLHKHRWWWQYSL
jgi:hypothetical protein